MENLIDENSTLNENNLLIALFIIFSIIGENKSKLNSRQEIIESINRSDLSNQEKKQIIEILLK